MKKSKAICVLAIVGLLSSNLGGCTVGNTQIRLETIQLHSHKTVFQINNNKCELKYAKLYMCNYRNLYGRAYGMDLEPYDFGSDSLEDYVKDVTLQELARIYCMDMIAQQKKMSLTDEEEKLVKDMMRGSNLDSARSIKMKENSILFRIQEAEERRLRLYEDYKAEILDEDEYSQLKEHYIAEKQRLEHELQKQRQRALELEKRIKICDAQMERMRGILNQNEFDEELVHELIKKIYVGMDNSVEVEFKCSDPYQEVLAIMSEVQNE